MNSPDQHTILRAIEDARRILEEYIGPAPSDPAQTLQRLLVVLDRGDLVQVLDRISSRRVRRLNTKSPVQQEGQLDGVTNARRASARWP